MRIGEIMAYISDFGTKCAALTLVLGLSLTTSGLSAANGSNVDLSVSGLRNLKGQLMVCMTKNPKAFPDCSKDANAIRKLVPASSASNIEFSGVAPGTYAVAIVHDENKNNKMDLSLFIPKEGFAFSRNPTITVGPPKFKNAAFVVGSADSRQSVKMKYMF
jgi:uncharacterized protein (DUF2141 family)